MTPLFSVPDDGDPVPVPASASGRAGRGRLASRDRRPTARGPADSRTAGSRATGTRATGSGAAGSGPAGSGATSSRATGSRARRDGPETPDLLTVTGERLRRALARSFLRYGVPGDPEVAVHAAMNVVEPVLQARETEILRLRRLMPAKRPSR